MLYDKNPDRGLGLIFTLSLGILGGNVNVSILGNEGRRVPPDDDIRQC